MELADRVRTALAAGDPEGAATAVIRDLGPSVHGYLCALHGDDDGADVFSRWAEDVWKGVAGFRFESGLRPWAFRVAWNASARFRREGWRLRRVRLPTSAASRLAASVTREPGAGPGDERLRRLRQDLDPDDHSLLILRLDRQLAWDEISAVLSEEGRPISAAALRKRFERLKGRLARQARRRGLLS